MRLLLVSTLAGFLFESDPLGLAPLLLHAPVTLAGFRLVRFRFGLRLCFPSPGGQVKPWLARWFFLSGLIKTCPLSSPADANVIQFNLLMQYFYNALNAQNINKGFQQLLGNHN